VERLTSLGVIDQAGWRTLVVGVRRKQLGAFEARNPKGALQLVEAHGVDYRSPFNFTPLMLAAEAGNLELARMLVERGADPELLDNAGRTALQLALVRSKDDAGYAREVLPGLWSLLAPASVSFRVAGRLVKVDAHLIEYVLFQLMYALLRDHLCTKWAWRRGMRSTDLLAAAQRLPFDALRPDRRRREYLNGVLARNEVDRDYAYNRRLFLRVSRGYYVLNPQLELRSGGSFTPIYDVMGVRQMAGLGLRRYVGALKAIENARASSLTHHHHGAP
jgi:hypothetical protein